MTIEQAAIAKQTGDDALSTAEGERVDCTFNPESLRVSISKPQPPQSSGNDQAAVDSNNVRLDVTLFFDTTDTGEDVREGHYDRKDGTNVLKALAGPTDGAPAPTTIFAWGTFRFTGAIETLTETLDFWSAEGVPLRSTVQLSMAGNQLDDYDESKLGFAKVDPPESGWGTTEIATLGGDSGAGRDIARENEVENPRFPALNNLNKKLDKVNEDIDGAMDKINEPFDEANAALGELNDELGKLSIGSKSSSGNGLSIGGGVGGGGAGAGAGLSLGLSADVGIKASAGFKLGFSAGASVGFGFGASAGGGAGFGIGGGAGIGFGADIGLSIGGGINAGIGGGLGAGIGGAGASAGVSFGASASAGASFEASASASASAGSSAGVALAAGTTGNVGYSGTAEAALAASASSSAAVSAGANANATAGASVSARAGASAVADAAAISGAAGFSTLGAAGSSGIGAVGVPGAGSRSAAIAPTPADSNRALASLPASMGAFAGLGERRERVARLDIAALAASASAPEIGPNTQFDALGRAISGSDSSGMSANGARGGSAARAVRMS